MYAAGILQYADAAYMCTAILVSAFEWRTNYMYYVRAVQSRILSWSSWAAYIAVGCCMCICEQGDA